MSTIVIGFLEREYRNDKERAAFHSELRTSGISVAHSWSDQTTLGVPTILFFHGNDRNELGTPASSGLVMRPELTNVFKIEYGAEPQSPTASPWDAHCTTRYINWQRLRDGIAGFVKDVCTLDELNATALHGVITKHFFEADPELEELLSPFATASPFKAPGQEAKTVLDAYIAEKLGNPGP